MRLQRADWFSPKMLTEQYLPSVGQKQKQQASPSTSGGGSISNHDSDFMESAATSHANLQQSGRGMQTTMDVEFADLFHGSGLSLDALTPGLVSPITSRGNNNIDNLSIVSESYPSRHARPEHNDYFRRPSSVPLSSSVCPDHVKSSSTSHSMPCLADNSPLLSSTSGLKVILYPRDTT